MTRERFIEICERLGWRVHEVDGCCIELEKYSPEGEDFSFTIYVYEGREYWAEVLDAWGDFDPDEHANMWYGQNRGEPASLRVLLDDAEAIKDMLEQLWRALLEEDEKASCTECGAQVRTARAAYRAKQEQEQKEREVREEKERQERAAAEQREHEQQLEQAERDLRAGKYITAGHFEQLAERYGVALPIKLVGWLREHCGSIRLEAHPECGGYFTQYYYDKGHKSTSIGTYGEKLGKAMGI